MSRPLDSGPAPILLVDPWDGLYRTARNADKPSDDEIRIPFLIQPVTVAIDERGVPHIFAGSDRDAVITMGYLSARDRLFQLDYIPRVAAGRLSEAFGEDLIETDRFLRKTGMLRSARENVQRIVSEGGQELRLAQWFANGANTYIDSVDEKDLPIEFRLLGYKPDRMTPLHQSLLVQFMIYDLTFETDDVAYSTVLDRVGDREFDRLFPENNYYSVPIVDSQDLAVSETDEQKLGPHGSENRRFVSGSPLTLPEDLLGRFGGFIPGKGSNNWAVSGSRSTTGHPILAGDMHLSLTLPAIWYEVHISTPTMNTYGVTIPGAPVPIEAFNDYLAWAFTNTASDQIDFFRLQLSPDGSQYILDGEFTEFELIPDTIRVKDRNAVIDTLRYSVWGPVFEADTTTYSLRWVAHEHNRNLDALWRMNHAADMFQFEEALRVWDAPMQNILVADLLGDIAIRSVGYLPVRSQRAYGLMDGTASTAGWSGRVPFDELPFSQNPVSGYLSSTNQQPAGDWYPHYLGHDWRSTFRSIRIDSLLRSKSFHSVTDLMRYQSDTRAVSFQMLKPVIAGIDGLGAAAENMRQTLLRWDGDMNTDSPDPIQFEAWFRTLKNLLWDEPVFSLVRPSDGTLIHYITEVQSSSWFDVVSTPVVEDRALLLSESFERAARSLTNFHGTGGSNDTWGDVHHVVFRHLTRSDGLRALWRGPFPFPGFSETLLPGSGREVYHSASWRIVVDFSPDGPKAYGIFPGGQSGNPFSARYDSSIDDYLESNYYELQAPATASEIDSSKVTLITMTP